MKRKNFFNTNADCWDEEISIPKKEKIRCSILPLLNLNPYDKIIDIACGTGILVPFIKEFIKEDKNITELDFSQNMINKAKEKFGSDINYIVSNAENIQAENNYFSKAVIFNAFPHFENKQKVISEIFRILQNNAIILLAHSDSKKNINALHKQIGGAVGKDVFPPNETIKIYFETAGFKNIEIVDNNKIFYIKAIKQEEAKDV